jgi:hypothetical protein
MQQRITFGRVAALVVSMSATVFGCADDQAGFAESSGGGQGTGGAPAGGTGGIPAPQKDLGPNAPEGDFGAPDPACESYAFRGQTYNCAELDRCTEQDISYRLACCQCDPAYCDPAVGCEAPPAADGGGLPEPPPAPGVESCMQCHNGAQANDYSGPGLSNPHPFRGAEKISCTGCHGGNPNGIGKLGSHVPPPPSIGDRAKQLIDPFAFFNRRTLAGIDKLQPAEYQDPTQPGTTFTNLDWLQFVNPGDLRVVGEGRGCGAQGCHFNKHAQWFTRAPIGTEMGFFSVTRFLFGIDNMIPEHRGRDKDGDTLADSAFRAVNNPAYNEATREVGEVGRLLEQRELAQYDGPMRDNAAYDSAALPGYLINAAQDAQRPNRVRAESPLHHLLDEQVSITCGDCHAGSAGQNDRYADFRSSGCTACHMEYSYDGRSRSNDPNVNKNEPANPDAIAPGERSHIESHQIRNVAKILPNGGFVRGISDHACVGCHQGSNRTVLQYWGIRLDQNQDLVNNFQYPAAPVTFTNTANDERLFDPAIANQTFNGRNANQYIWTEDYDGDGRDDTPADVHFEAGLGCIDCHGSRDVHGGTEGDPTSGRLQSRMDQQVKIRCENCHGGIDAYAPTRDCTTYTGAAATCTQDAEGNALRNLTRDANGDYWLTSRLDGRPHYVPQTRDVVVNQPGKRHPITGRQLYSPKASYAMGRADGDLSNGIGPVQNNPALVPQGFAHTDTMECAVCHSSWQNNCIGCHLRTQYDVNPNNYFFSNITGERILLKQANADFTYISPIMMYLGINTKGKIQSFGPHMKVFYGFIDRNGTASNVITAADRLGEGNNANNGARNAFPGLGHNAFFAHSIRGKVSADKEGPRYCVSCHLNQAQIANFGAGYDAFRTNYANNNFNQLDFNLLKQHIGQNPGNQLNSPYWVHMAAGLGSGLFLFDADGCPVNPLDNNANRKICNNGAPAANFNLNNVKFDLDRMVTANGVPNTSSTRPIIQAGKPRIGASNPELSGPLDAQTIQKLSDPNGGRVLDSWIDANGDAQGAAANFIQ